MKSIRTAAVAAILAISAQSAIADVIGFENFDGGAINLSGTSNVFDYGAGGGTGGDAFGRVVPFVTGAPFLPTTRSAASAALRSPATPAASLARTAQRSLVSWIPTAISTAQVIR